MKHREADAAIVFRHWVRANPPQVTCSFEIKDSKGKDSLPFAALEDHQVVYAEAIRDSAKGVLMRVQGTNGEPDYIYLYRDPVFIVIKYPKCFCIIALAHFIAERAVSKRKSLLCDRARAIAQEVVDL